MTNTAPAAPPQLPNEVYGMFVGYMDQFLVAKVANAISIAINGGVTHIHLAFQSAGGNIGDGVAMYNLFKAIPIPLTLYNIGNVSSAGVTAFLGAANRAVSKHGTFMIHRTTSPAVAATSDRLKAMTQSVVLDDDRTEAIFATENLKLSSDQRDLHKVADLWLSAQEAVTMGLATTIAEFAPPKGQQLFYVGPT